MAAAAEGEANDELVVVVVVAAAAGVATGVFSLPNNVLDMLPNVWFSKTGVSLFFI